MCDKTKPTSQRKLQVATVTHTKKNTRRSQKNVALFADFPDTARNYNITVYTFIQRFYLRFHAK